MKRPLLLFVLFILCRMAIAQSPVASLAVFHYHNTVLPSMDLTYRYLRPCSDTVILKATVYNRVARYTVVWQNSVIGDSIIVTKPGSYVAVLKNPAGAVVERDTIVVPPQQDLQPMIEIHRSVTPGNDTLIAFPQQPPTSTQYFYKWYRDIWEVAAGNYPMLINPQPGTYKVYVRSATGCSGYSDTVNFHRTENTLSVDFSYQVTACNPQLVYFVGTANTQDSVTYRWNFGDGGELENRDVWHPFPAGTYNVTLTVTTVSGQTGSITKPLTIQTADSTTWITNIIQEPNQCGDTVWLSASNNQANAYYFWKTGEQTKTIAATASGSYVVRVYDTCYNLKGYDSVNVIVEAPCTSADTTDTPAGPTVWQDPTEYYWNGDSTYISFLATVPYPYEDVKSFSWSSDGGDLRAVVDRHPYVALFSFSTPGAHTVTFTTTMKDNVSGMYADTSTTFEFIIRNSYAAHNSWHMKDTTISAGDTLTLHAGNPGGSYFWYSSDGQFTSEGEAVKITKAGLYNLYIWRDYDFCADWINVSVEDSLNLKVLSMTRAAGEATLGIHKVKAFPNPSKGQVYLQFENPLPKAVVVKVYNLNGRLMYNRTTTQQLQSLDLSNLPKGYYLIELTGYDQKKVLSLILQ
ncbi:T9SS type A sorting domain-containing protein [Chitinophaga sp. S165]|uniref:T9SS type A sorting domain-containing protein n=1 Tax=Chitinophaga sp. S165 TaxID=2135462 RepID=UPI000D716AAF|nr:T9SS type A sorting domain-containing protein [Chitinophaga sp. S165]PWV49731.1 putative secreted protein (Por secretion system target) [Chitinophaga sp. S165]